jgi:CheY-like chemotaxis protein
VYEYLDVSSQLKRLIANNAPEGVLREEAVKMGMVSLFQDAWQKVADGTTTITEVMGKVPYYGSLHHAAVHVPEAPEPKTEIRETGATVVLVDSDPADVSLFQSAFDSQGYRLVVSEWASAYETVCRENPDAIVLNLDQSEADWRSLGASLQSSLSTVTIPVLLLKSDTEWTMEVESLQQGAAGVLHRPLEPVEVLARLDNALKLAV